MRKLRFNLAQPTLGRPQYVPMATTGMPHTRARLTATTALIILLEVCLSAQVRGSMASMVAGTMVDGAATTVAVGTETMTDSVVAGNSVAKADGRVVVGSVGTGAPAVAENSIAVAASRAAGSVEVTGFMVAASPTEAAIVEVSAAMADSMVVEDPTEGAAGSCYSILLSHLNGWQLMLPAVFLFPFAHNQGFSRDSMPDTVQEDSTLSFCAHPITTPKEHLMMSPGNAILLNGVMQTANREIGVPGF